MFAWFDKDGDGSLSPAEVARLPIPAAVSHFALGALETFSQAVPFAAIDANKDGKVSKEEFRAYYRSNGFTNFTFSLQTYKAMQAKQLDDAIVKRLDPKGDGRLTAAKVAGMYEKFRSLDENEDEIITPAELTNRGSGYGLSLDFGDIDVKMAPPRTPVSENSLRDLESGQTDSLVGALLTKYDLNKDGKLSRKEIGLGEAAFARFDADGDGFLSPAELKAYLAGEPDLAFRLQLGAPTTGITLANEKTIDPAMKKKYRRGSDNGLAIRLGDTDLSLQIPDATGTGPNVMKNTYLNFYNAAAGKKDHVTRADLVARNYQILVAMFSQADKDDDGKLTRAELANWLDLLSTARGINLTLTCNDLGRSLFDVLDADRDGRLSLREMRTAWKRLGPLAKGGSVGQNDLARTMRLDISFGGRQSFGPVPAALVLGTTSPLRPADRTGAPVWFRKMDKNNDGDISPREWLGTDEEFKAIDADGDGLISADEATAFEAKKKTKAKELLP